MERKREMAFTEGREQIRPSRGLKRSVAAKGGEQKSSPIGGTPKIGGGEKEEDKTSIR